MKTLKAAIVQMTSNADLDHNLATARILVGEACALGAELVVLPEFFVCISSNEEKKLEIAEPYGEGKIQNFLSELAAQHGIHLVGGSIPLETSQKGKVFNTCLLYTPSGSCIARYDKIHLFRYRSDRESYDETKTMIEGKEVVAQDCPFGRLGLSICYDVRFPELYRAMGNPDVIAVPTAFTVPTGRDHWELLVRARAVENQCFVVASCQVGEHDGGRKTWGHSIIAGPWGEILARIDDEQGVGMAVLNAGMLEKCRNRLPALENRMM